MWRRDWSVALGTMIFLALLDTSAHSSVKQGLPPPTPDKVEELSALGRLWGEVKFVQDPDARRARRNLHGPGHHRRAASLAALAGRRKSPVARQSALRRG